jgi:Na+-transporting NADH:ubiquinone oxidoreductase subunit C
MFFLTLCFTSMVSGVRLLNEDRIETNQKVKLQKIVLRVLGVAVDEKASHETLLHLYETRVKPVDLRGTTLYVGVSPDGQSVTGYALPVSGPGFWGPIYGMVSVDTTLSQIRGVAFYKHSETPGLGGRLMEKWFTDQFIGLKLPRGGVSEKLFTLTPPGTAKTPDHLDAITGATQTSRAIEAFLNRELHRLVSDLRSSTLTSGHPYTNPGR